MKHPYYNFDADESFALYLKEDPLLEDVPHFHDSVEFIFIKKGNVECFLETNSQVLGVGDIFFAESYETHYYLAKEKEISAIVLVLSRDYIQTFRNLYPGLTFETFLTDKEKNAKIFEIMNEWLNTKNRTQIYNHAMVNLLFSSLVEKYEKINRHPYEGDILQKELLRYIHLHYLEDITVISMARDLGYSPEYCSKILKKCLKHGVRTYINSLRLRKAKEMLEDKSLKLTQLEVLYACGFSSPSTYYRVKKQIEDMK